VPRCVSVIAKHISNSVPPCKWRDESPTILALALIKFASEVLREIVPIRSMYKTLGLAMRRKMMMCCTEMRRVLTLPPRPTVASVASCMARRLELSDAVQRAIERAAEEIDELGSLASTRALGACAVYHVLRLAPPQLHPQPSSSSSSSSPLPSAMAGAVDLYDVVGGVCDLKGGSIAECYCAISRRLAVMPV
jgi:hypothetical protein